MLLILFFHLTDRDGATSAAGNRILIIFQGMSCFMLGRGMRMLRKTHTHTHTETERETEREKRNERQKEV